MELCVLLIAFYLFVFFFFFLNVIGTSLSRHNVLVTLDKFSLELL